MHFDVIVVFPLVAAILMALSCSLLGVLLFVTRRLLIGESLSHAAFPGAVFSAAVAAMTDFSENMALLVVVLATVSSLFGQFLVNWLTKKRGVSQDAALSFVLSSFFGLGVLLASQMQRLHPESYRQALVYLFGQVATMTLSHVLIYGLLAVVVVLVVFLFFRPLKTASFDSGFATVQGLMPRYLVLIISLLTVISIVVSLRSVGVVLLSAILVAPATAARQWSSSFSVMMVLAGFFGAISGLGGALLSLFSGSSSLPTGPTIALVACFLALMSLLFAPKRGYCFRSLRTLKFSWKCRSENVMKALYKEHTLSCHHKWTLFIMRLQKMVKKDAKGLFCLTKKGEERAVRVIRLHRLFELYLTRTVGIDKERVHAMAEEAEHAITPEMEHELDHELDFPSQDPHKQPIPGRSRP